MGFTVLFPLLAPIGREIGLNELQITAIISLSSLTVFIASPLWGRFSDRVGRKKVMLLGLFGFALGTCLFNSVLYAGLNGSLLGLPLFAALILARMTHAAIMSATMPAANAYMADITDASNRTKGMGAAGAANNLGSILGPFVAGLAVISLLTPLWIMALVAALNGLFIWRFLPEPPRQAVAKKRARMKYTEPRIMPFIVVGVLMFSGFALVQQTMGFRFQDVLQLTTVETTATLSLAMGLSALSSLIAQGVIVQRLDLAPFTLLRLAIPLLIVAFVILAISTTQFGLTLAMMILGFGMGLAGPGFMAGASLAVAPEEQGMVAGIAGSCGPLGFAIGPFVGGLMYQYQPVLPYAFAAVMFLVLLACMQWLGNRVTVHSTPDTKA